MKYLLILLLMSGYVSAELPRVEGCIKDKVYKAIDQNGNVIVVSCTVLRVFELGGKKS